MKLMRLSLSQLLTMNLLNLHRDIISYLTQSLFTIYIKSHVNVKTMRLKSMELKMRRLN